MVTGFKLKYFWSYLNIKIHNNIIYCYRLYSIDCFKFCSFAKFRVFAMYSFLKIFLRKYLTNIECSFFMISKSSYYVATFLVVKLEQYLNLS